MPTFADDFDGPDLDTTVWVPHHLPQWSSRAATAAAYEVRGSCLRLFLPAEQPHWCPDDHPPLRVSAVRSGVSSGPVGSTVGQQPVRPGVVVREEQRAQAGLDADVRPAGGAGADDPGRPVDGGLVVGRLAIDVADFHTYAVDWRPDGAVFPVDGDPVRSVAVAPDHPMQSMLAVFDFPDRGVPGEPCVVPELVVDVVRGYRSAFSSSAKKALASATKSASRTAITSPCR